ncbi:MAG: glycosyltransferase [Candidatus Lokiarchaeota archaeon]|nr:glycosyltransferase [Candidatus Lokiarchaeota archaeon]
MKKVTIFMPSYNHEKFVGDAIKSVLDQSFSNFEFFIVDDASTDNSWSIIQKFKDKRIQAFRNNINRNDKNIFKEIIYEKAKGEYTATINSDDIWENDKLLKQVSYLDNHQEIAAVFTKVSMIWENGEPFVDVENPYYKIFDQPNRTRHEWLNYFFFTGNALCHPSALLRKKIHNECGFYRNGFYVLADYDMWVRICLKHEIYIMPERLLRFRICDNNMNISANRPDTRIRHRFEKLQILENFLNISSFQELIRIFPEANKYYRKDGIDIGYILAMLALDPRLSPELQLFGLHTLFDLFNDTERSARVLHLYNFSKNDYAKLTGEYDVFSLEALKYLNSQMDELSTTPNVALIMGRLFSILFPKDSIGYRVIRKIYKFIFSK